MPLSAFLALTFVVSKTVDWIRALLPKKLAIEVLFPLSIIVGVLATLIFCTVDVFAKDMTFGKYGSLFTLGWVAQAIFGFGVGCSAGAFHDVTTNGILGTLSAPVVVHSNVVLPGPTPADTPPAPDQATG